MRLNFLFFNIESSSEQDDTSNEDKLEQIIETVTDKQEDGNISNRSTGN